MVTAADIRATAAACRAALEPHAGGDWTVPAGDLEWTCHFTLGHISGAVLYYAVNLALRSTEQHNAGRIDPAVPVDELLDILEGRAAVLAELVEKAPPDARGHHAQGRADPSGFAAMACDEMLIHTDDIASGLGVPFEGPADVSARVAGRLFPWGPADTPPWETLRWLNGRAALGDRPRLTEEWTWHPAPLDEWDGTDPTA